MKKLLYLCCTAILVTVIILLTGLGPNKIVEDDLNVLTEENPNELFHSYLLSQAKILFDQRRQNVDSAMGSPVKLMERQLKLKDSYLKLIGELPDTSTPLKPVITDTIFKEECKIEVIAFESRPNFHVTTNLYVPHGDGPFPGILVPCGHYSKSKVERLHQDLGMLLASHGYMALFVDAFCQGERYQFLNESGKPATRGGTTVHTLLDVGANLVGTSVVAYELWDNIRALDYLMSRGDVDTSMIGVMGSSAGGGQVTNLITVDERIDVAAIGCYITKEEYIFNILGPQDGCQNLFYEGLEGIDHPDYITMFAPKPFILLAATGDFFPIYGTRATFNESQLVYDSLGYSDNIRYFEYNDDHGFSQPRREAAVRWMNKCFFDNDAEVVEPKIQIPTVSDSLLVTSTDQVLTFFEDEVTVQDFNLAKANELATNREDFWLSNTKDSCLNMVKSLLNITKDTVDPEFEVVGTISRENYDIDKYVITQNTDVSLPGLLFKPKDASGQMPLLVYVDGRGKNTDTEVGGMIEQFVLDSGKIVFAVDLRGFGETKDNPALNETKHWNLEHRNAVISAYIGKPLIGQRVIDIQKTLLVVKQIDLVDTNAISIMGIDRASTAVIHAAAFDSTIQEIYLRRSKNSWVDIVAASLDSNNMTHVVPNALMYYDLPDLVSAISPREVKYVAEPVVLPSAVNTIEPGNSFNLNIFPNPITDKAVIDYQVDNKGLISIEIIGLNGQLIKTVIHSYHKPGTYQVVFETEKLKTGTYICVFNNENEIISTQKLVKSN